MKNALTFLYTFSVHWMLKRNSNLYYSITTKTGQPPKLSNGFWAWNHVRLFEFRCLNLLRLDDTAFLSVMTQVCFTRPNGQMWRLICIPNSQTGDWLISRRQTRSWDRKGRNLQPLRLDVSFTVQYVAVCKNKVKRSDCDLRRTLAVWVFECKRARQGFKGVVL